jgi:transketolase
VKLSDLEQSCVNRIRFLSVDMVEKPAPDIRACDRDRFVLSAGHRSALLYSLLHLTGYDLSLKQIQRFRQCW